MTTSASELSSTTTRQVPRGRAGWWHEYVCPTHGTELSAGARETLSDGPHLCPHGCVLRGEPYQGAWQVIELQQCAREFRDLAHQYAATGHESHREDASGLLSQFCSLYADAVADGLG